MEQANLVANELHQMGFTTKVTSNGVIVSLNRKVNKMEVWIALNQIFGEIEFNIQSTSKGVLVS